MLRPFIAWRFDPTPRTYLFSVFFALALFGAGGLLAGSAQAGSEVYTVRDMPVDAEAKSAAQAREVALAEGQRAAFALMIGRVVVAEDRGRLPALNDAQIADLIDGFEIADERVSPTRYRASLTVTFREDAIKSMLRGRELRFAESTGRPVVVIPVMIGQSGPLLWSDENLWLLTWSGRDVPGGLVPIVVPLGDTADIESLNAAQASAGDAVALENFAARYGAGEAIVAEARVTPAADATGVAMISLNVHRIGAETPGSFTEDIQGAPGQALEKLLVQAAERVAARINEGWKVANVIQYGTPASLRAIVPINSLREWVDLRATLGGMSMIADVEIITLGRTGANIVLRYFGNQSQLESALGGRDLVLTPRPEGDFTLAPRVTPGAKLGSL